MSFGFTGTSDCRRHAAEDGDALDIELQIVADSAAIRFARNQTLPLLAFQYTYSHNGYSRLASDTFNQAWSNKFEGHTVGLNLSFPIGNEAAKSQLRQALLNRLQQLATHDQRAPCRSARKCTMPSTPFSTDWQRILAAHKRVDDAGAVLGVEIRQFNQGFRTSTEVLDAQAKLGRRPVVRNSRHHRLPDCASRYSRRDRNSAASGVHFDAEGKGRGAIDPMTCFSAKALPRRDF